MQDAPTATSEAIVERLLRRLEKEGVEVGTVRDCGARYTTRHGTIEVSGNDHNEVKEVLVAAMAARRLGIIAICISVTAGLIALGANLTALLSYFAGR